MGTEGNNRRDYYGTAYYRRRHPNSTSDILEKVQEICTRHGVLLIVDEVICGFGRTGKEFGHQHFNLKPDIITMAKGLTSAYLPLSVTAIRKDIYEKFDTGEDNSHFRHVNTFGGIQRLVQLR